MSARWRRRAALDSDEEESEGDETESVKSSDPEDVTSAAKETMKSNNNNNAEDASGADPDKPLSKSERVRRMREKFLRRERKPAHDEPELHVVGEVVGGVGFGKGVCCKFKVESGKTWDHLGGNLSGQTHVDYPSDGTTAVWAHPIDVHFSAKTMQGWPRILFQVWKMDDYGRIELSGYGFTHVPVNPGAYSVEVPTWRPVGSLREEIAAHFLGGTPQLRDIDVLFQEAWSDRCRLLTTTSGTIQLRFSVVHRNFQKHDIDGL